MISPFSSSKPPRRSSSSGQRRASVQLTVLLVDDQAVARLGVRSVLAADSRITVASEASDGVEAVRMAEDHQPDLIMLEPEVPRRSGTALVEALIEAAPNSQILILSAYDRDELIRELVDGRVAGYLSKRDTPARILEAVREIGKGAVDWVSPSISRRLMQVQRRISSLRQLQLTDREIEALQVLAEGASNREIGNRLCVSVGTVKNHLTSIYEKLDVDSRAEAIVWMHQNQATVG